ncbi:hypothetical protein [Microbulbifer sp. ALW1]|nr:hypothetical protein [Microbulbifer sp. ALW1]
MANNKRKTMTVIPRKAGRKDKPAPLVPKKTIDKQEACTDGKAG